MIRIHDAGKTCPFRRDFWKNRKIEIQWVDEPTDEVLAKDLADLILTDPNSSSEYLKSSGRMSRENLLVRFIDHLVLEKGKYWPGSTGLTTYRKLLVEKAGALDISAWAYVTGHSPWARLAVYSAFDIGYRQIRIITENKEEADKFVQDFSHFCFGLQLQVENRSHLTLQANNGSLLINTEKLSEDQELLETLMYLNFIRRGGLISDFEFGQDEGALCKEGVASGFDVVPGNLYRGVQDADFLMTQKLMPASQKVSYVEEWLEFVKTQKPAKDPVPNSPADS